LSSFLQAQDGNFLLAQEGTYFLLQEAIDMADQIEIHLVDTIVPEETTFTATCYFRTRSTQTASIPTTIHYRVDCLSTKTRITDWTLVSSPAASRTIVITSTENQILDDSHLMEVKQLTVKADDGLSTQVIKPVQWKVRNLQGIT
jgi:hypothetical protein